MNVPAQVDWPDRLYAALKRAGVRQVGYVPDAGHARLIERCRADPDIHDVALTTEEEGVALAAGASAWLLAKWAPGGLPVLGAGVAGALVGAWLTR